MARQRLSKPLAKWEFRYLGFRQKGEGVGSRLAEHCVTFTIIIFRQANHHSTSFGKGLLLQDIIQPYLVKPQKKIMLWPRVPNTIQYIPPSSGKKSLQIPLIYLCIGSHSQHSSAEHLP